MASKTQKQLLHDLLLQADVVINGNRPWDITVKNDAVYDRVMKDGLLGIGESYMAGDWECDQIDVLTDKVMRANLEQYVKNNLKLISYTLGHKVLNVAKKSKAFGVGEKHYNTGNDLFQRMLDKRMVYTCGYWKNAKNLDEAQEAKLDLICKKIGLQKGMRVLDIGGGWGSFAKFAAEKYGASVVNITVSKEQVALANELCKGLPVENRLMDYRDVNEKFDRIVSVGMFEHVGYKNYRTYMEIASKSLKPDGLFLLHTIGGNQSGVSVNAWFDKCIFPNSMLPSIKQIAAASEGLFVMEDWHNFGTDYDKTLMQWHKNFEDHWDEISDKYSETFYRMWRFYLLGCAGSFRARGMQLWQIVLSPKGVPGGYESIR